MSPRPGIWFGLLALAAGCRAADGALQAEMELAASPLGIEIAELEDARSSGGGRLMVLALESDEARVRERAALALGRLPFPSDEPDGGSDATRALLELLFDLEPRVRAAAAFALGLRGDPAAGDKLCFVALDEHERDKEPLVRARAVEALSKLARPDLHPRLLDALADPDPEVRREVLLGAHRWPKDREDAAAVDAALIASLDREQGDNVWCALFALERREATAARPAFHAHARSKEPLERVFAARGLARIEPAAEDVAVLFELARDPDERVAAEAMVALGRHSGADIVGALRRGTAHADSHVRVNAWAALGALIAAAWEKRGSDGVLGLGLSDWLDARTPYLAHDGSSAVRAAALATAGMQVAVEVGDGAKAPGPGDMQQFQDSVQGELGDSSPVLRAGLARYWYRFPSAMAVPCLAFHARDPDPLVATAAIEGLGQHPTRESRALLHALLADADNGKRLAAIGALSKMAEPEDLPLLERAFAETTGDIATEVRFEALRCARQIGGERAVALLRQASAAPEPFVRKTALQMLAELRMEASAPAPAPAPQRTAEPVPIPGRDFPVWAQNPRVRLVTSKGAMDFELFPAEAPIHVHSFLTLVEQGHYDGLRFHRVVPDFVIQGGDYRGDGNGGTTWLGASSLRHEIGPRKYVRGSLGMPRNDDPDSGGSQIFVTHRPTPHLDGRYTIFGELRAGFDVLDAIEVGDVIRSARILD